MLRALLLVVDPSRTWEAIKNDQHSVVRLSFQLVLPLLLVTSAGEAFGLMRLGFEHGRVTETLTKAPLNLAVRYEVVQAAFTLFIIYAGSALLKLVGSSFHRRHSYQECFTTLAYCIAPLLFLRMLDGVPAINTWVCFGIGIFLTLSLLYRGIPFIMRPDPSNALGLFILCSLLLLVTTGLAHFVAQLVLDERFLAAR
jgi:Yip1-like protein